MSQIWVKSTGIDHSYQFGFNMQPVERLKFNCRRISKRVPPVKQRGIQNVSQGLICGCLLLLSNLLTARTICRALARPPLLPW